MAVKVVKISSIIPNKDNPRIIKDEKFHKLVTSLKDFPEMATVRPIVVNKDMVVLGGNMRLKAMNEAGWEEVPVEVVDWTEEKQKEFIIKDNVGFGEWDWEMIANEWDAVQLTDWGFDVPNWSAGLEENTMTDDDIDLEEEFDPIGVSAGKQRVVFIFDSSEEAESYLNSLNVDFVKRNMAWQVDMTTKLNNE